MRPLIIRTVERKTSVTREQVEKVVAEMFARLRERERQANEKQARKNIKKQP